MGLDGSGVGAGGSGSTGSTGEGGLGVEGGVGSGVDGAVDSGTVVSGATGLGTRSFGILGLVRGGDIAVAAIDTLMRFAGEISSRSPPPFVAVPIANAAANATTAAPTTSMICRLSAIAYLTRYPSAFNFETAWLRFRIPRRIRSAAVL
jgi:hypothetical protein